MARELFNVSNILAEYFLPTACSNMSNTSYANAVSPKSNSRNNRCYILEAFVKEGLSSTLQLFKTTLSFGSTSAVNFFKKNSNKTLILHHTLHPLKRAFNIN
uniref:Putative ovule protein n=1 Tax=Solanum chacoense TaxID=4108 RepID=A0A0V0GMB6_SOLCH